jgi:hypothetical protein
VGAWGVALFSDDVACDVRDGYRELIEDGVDDEEATRRVLETNEETFSDEDDGPVAWLSLAVTQSKVGRLAPHVRAKALEVLDTGADLDRWDEDPQNLARRRVVLDAVRAQLVGPQPNRKKLRRPRKRYITDLRAGDVLSFVGSNRRIALVRVARIEEERHVVAPILRVLRYSGTTLPSEPEIASLPDRPRVALEPPLPSPPWSSSMWMTEADGEDDYDKVGFRRVTNIGSRPGDENARAWTYGSWHSLATSLEYNLASEGDPG